MGTRPFVFGVVAAVVVFAACVGDDPSSSSNGGDDGGSNDGSISDVSSSDANANDSGVGDSGSGGCNLDLPFVTPATRVHFEGDSAISVVARLTENELNAVMNIDPDGGHLGIVSRTDPTGVFGPFQEITSIETGSNEFVGSLTGDGKTLYYQNDTTPFPHIWSATAGAGVANFTGAQNVTTLNGSDVDSQPYISNDGSEIWFVSYRSGNADLYVSENTGAGFSTPRAVDELNSSLEEQVPAITADKLTIYFTRYNNPDSGASDADIWTAHRATTSSTFSTPQRVTEIDTPNGEFSDWISPDGCRLYYSQNYALYVVAKPAK